MKEMIDDNGSRISRSAKVTEAEGWMVTVILLILTVVTYYFIFVDNDAKVRHAPPSETMEVR